MKGVGSKPYMRRLVTHDGDARAITDEIAAITWAVHSFTVCHYG